MAKAVARPDAAPVSAAASDPGPPPPREFLDLNSSHRDEGSVQLLREILTTSRKIVVVAGAGISVAAGIPDFRSSKGLFASMKAKGRAGQTMFDSSVYRSPETILEFHEMTCNLYEASQSTKPTPFHELLESLAKSDRLLRLYTQNVDFLDTRHETLKTVVPIPPSAPWPKVIAVHGSLEKMTCTKCQVVKDFDPRLFRIWKEDTPECTDCKKDDEARIAAGRRRLGVGFVRPRMVLYGEPGYDALNIGSCMAADLRSRPDALIVVGTTLKIPGTRTMVKEMSKAIGNRGHVIWLNVEDAPTGEFDDIWDFVIKGDCQQVAHLMKDIPIPPKDQSFTSFVLEDNISASQQTEQDPDSSRDWWSVVVDDQGQPADGMLTPAPTSLSNSDDEKTCKFGVALGHLPGPATLGATRNTDSATLKTMNPVDFYKPLRGIKTNSLKRKRTRVEAVKTKKPGVARTAITNNGKKTKRKQKALADVKARTPAPQNTVVKIKLTPKAARVISNIPGIPHIPPAAVEGICSTDMLQKHKRSHDESCGCVPVVSSSIATIVESVTLDTPKPRQMELQVLPAANDPGCVSAPQPIHEPAGGQDYSSESNTTLPTETKKAFAVMEPAQAANAVSSDCQSTTQDVSCITLDPTLGQKTRKRPNKWANVAAVRKSARLSIN